MVESGNTRHLRSLRSRVLEWGWGGGGGREALHLTNTTGDEAEIFDLFSCESQQLVKTQFRCSCFRKSYVLLCSLNNPG